MLSIIVRSKTPFSSPIWRYSESFIRIIDTAEGTAGRAYTDTLSRHDSGSSERTRTVLSPKPTIKNLNLYLPSGTGAKSRH